MWPDYVKSVMIRLLSHVYIAFSAISKNGSLVVTVYLCHLYYKYFVFYILCHYCSRYPVIRKRYKADNTTFSLEIFTRFMPCITELHKDYCINKTKVFKFSIYNNPYTSCIRSLYSRWGNFYGYYFANLYWFLFNIRCWCCCCCFNN